MRKKTIMRVAGACPCQKVEDKQICLDFSPPQERNAPGTWPRCIIAPITWGAGCPRKNQRFRPFLPPKELPF
jgi:hypothetical protein